MCSNSEWPCLNVHMSSNLAVLLCFHSFGYNSHGGVSGEQRCGYPLDGPGKVLAHAFFPSDGRAHFDEAESYTDGQSRGTNLLWVATHEFGHALGLEHSNVRNAIMYPYYTGYVANMRLHSDDINGIRSLYGTVFFWLLFLLYRVCFFFFHFTWIICNAIDSLCLY